MARFKVWFDDGAITPSWVVNATNINVDDDNADDDFEHPFTGAIDRNCTKNDILKIAERHGVEASEIEFDD